MLARIYFIVDIVTCILHNFFGRIHAFFRDATGRTGGGKHREKTQRALIVGSAQHSTPPRQKSTMADRFDDATQVRGSYLL
jgi:hypothetical protein